MSSSTAAIMARRLAWAERMVREDDANARGQLEREMFATTISSDEQVLSMFSEWSQRTVPPHPLAELETSLALRGGHRRHGADTGAPQYATVGVKSIDEQLARTLDLIRCTSSSRSRSDDDCTMEESEALIPGTVDGGEPTTSSHEGAENATTALTKATLQSHVSTPTKRTRFVPRLKTTGQSQRAVSPDAGDSSCHWVSHTDHSGAGQPARRCDQRPVEFGGVLELMPSTAGLSPSAPASPRSVGQRDAADVSPGEATFPSPRLLQRAPDGIHHYALQSAYALKRLDYYTREDEFVRQSRRHSSHQHTGGRRSPPSPQHSPNASPLGNGDEVAKGRPAAATVEAPIWLHTTSAVPLNDGLTEMQHLGTAPLFEPGARGWDGARSTKASLDVSPLGLQALISRISDQLRCKHLSLGAQQHRSAVLRGRGGSLSPCRSEGQL